MTRGKGLRFLGRSLGVIFGLACGVPGLKADWPQWRGPERNGVSECGSLPASWPEDFKPAQLWESEPVPSDHYGGHGSAVVAEGKVYLSVVWHRDEPTPTRTLTSRVFGDLGYRGNNLGEALLREMEEVRMDLNPRLRGGALDEWAAKWADERLTEEQSLLYKSWVVQRFKQGKAAIPWTDLEVLRGILDREFENADVFRAWVEAQTFASPETGAKVLAAVPPTKMAANDAILCLDLETGATLWKKEFSGRPAGRSASSTPAVAGGVVYAMLSKGLYAVDAGSGELRWQQSLPGRGTQACSPMVVEGRVVVNTGILEAFHAETGEKLWSTDLGGASHSSPAIWKDIILVNGRNELRGIHLESGEVRWKQPGGGDSTPVVSGDHFVLVSKDPERSFAGYRLSAEGAQLLWKKEFMARRYGSSPVIRDGYAYHLGSDRHLCVDVQTGETKWEMDRSLGLSSPLLVGDRLLVFENNGGFLAMIPANPEKHELTGRVKIGALGSSSPALVGSKLVVRQKDRVVCYDLAQAETEG